MQARYNIIIYTAVAQASPVIPKNGLLSQKELLSGMTGIV